MYVYAMFIIRHSIKYVAFGWIKIAHKNPSTVLATRIRNSLCTTNTFVCVCTGFAPVWENSLCWWKCCPCSHFDGVVEHLDNALPHLSKEQHREDERNKGEQRTNHGRAKHFVSKPKVPSIVKTSEADKMRIIQIRNVTYK